MNLTKRGYTIIEILIFLAIAALAFGGGYTAYRQFTRKQTLDTAFASLKSELARAQELAFAGKKPQPDCGPGTVLNGYRVEIGDAAFTTMAVCRRSADGAEITADSRGTSTPPGVTIEGNPPSPRVLYKVLGQGADIGGSNEIELTFRQSRPRKQIRAKITKEGRLERVQPLPSSAP